MSLFSSIEWTSATWNPSTGCSKISPGCAHCYAETFAERFRGVPGHPFEQGFDLRLIPEKIAEPLRWRTARTVFVNSMSDLFHEQVPDDYIEAVAEVMATANWHTYQVLTKRSERLSRLLRGRLARFASLRHVWWGVSVEDRKYGLPRVVHLRQIPVPLRFLSVEPLLEDLGPMDLEGVHWVIVGGESGLGARPMQADWVTSIQEQCRKARVPFFFKQWGGLFKKRAGRELKGRTWDDIPRRAAAAMPTDEMRERLLSDVAPLSDGWSSCRLALTR